MFDDPTERPKEAAELWRRLFEVSSAVVTLEERLWWLRKAAVGYFGGNSPEELSLQPCVPAADPYSPLRGVLEILRFLNASYELAKDDSQEEN